MIHESNGALSVREVATVLELDPKTVYSAAQRGQIPTIVIGRRVLIPARWLQQKLDGTASNQNDALGELNVSQAGRGE